MSIAICWKTIVEFWYVYTFSLHKQVWVSRIWIWMKLEVADAGLSDQQTVQLEKINGLETIGPTNKRIGRQTDKLPKVNSVCDFSSNLISPLITILRYNLRMKKSLSICSMNQSKISNHITYSNHLPFSWFELNSIFKTDAVEMFGKFSYRINGYKY